MAAKKEFSVDNLEVRKDKNQIIVSVNPKIYPLDIVMSAAYIFIDKAYVIVDGDPNEELFVFLKTKDKSINLEELGREFNNELINYSFYAAQTIKNMPIREAIIQRAFFTHSADDADSGANKKDDGKVKKSDRRHGKNISRPRKKTS